MSLVTDRLNGVVGDLFGKAPCRTVSTTNITLSGLQAFGGVTQIEGDRHLATGQTDQSENGIYNASTGSWTRTKDFDGNRDVVQGTLVSVVNGASGANLYEVTAANPITISTSNITFSLRYGANVRHDQTPAEIAAGVTPTDNAYIEGHAYRYDMIGDGTINDATAFLNWLKVGAQGVELELPKPTSYYKIDSVVVLAALAGPLRIRAARGAEVRYTGSNTAIFVHIQDTNGYDVDLDTVWLNSNLKAARCLRIDNPSASMAASAIGKVLARRYRFENGYMNTGITQGACGALVSGGFSDVIFEDGDVINMDRDTGAGIAGSQGCAGLIAIHSSINAYVQRMIVCGGNIETITNNEVAGDAADVDCDGVIFSAPTATDNGDLHLPVKLHVEGVRFVNCKGRNVKSQADGYSVCHRNTVIRNLEEAINNAAEFDLQRGGGSIRFNELWYYLTGGAATTLGTSHSICSAGPDQLATSGDNSDGSIECSDNTIYNAIPSATDTLPFFMLATNGDTSRKLTGIVLCNNKVVGGRITRWLKSNGGTTDELYIRVENNEGDTTTSLVQFSASVDSSCKVIANGNRSYGGGTVKLFELADNSEPYIDAGGNTGFVRNLITISSASALGEVLRPALIGGDTADGHAFATCQTVTLADDASATFAPVGTYGIGIITNNFGDTTQAIFAHDSNSAVALITSGDISIGSGTTNPDVDGDACIWTDGTAINIKNRLGSSRTFHFFHFGGD